ncbi:Structural maintenance of chromosomes protein 3 [Camellia lanceoleosa]|uniref:Structural maintenance of chromosomes protein 3 n=1 Tax=Camellia lanceoleosa TaxID=1840588 RepID=A0ACC0FQR8_9ERIC|nr:Structural maintenance of chromosomes protein 3 [Camellia lanceoleosa]
MLLTEVEVKRQELRDARLLVEDVTQQLKNNLSQMQTLEENYQRTLQDEAKELEQLLTLDQYVNFTEQREELQKRQAELDAGDEKIRELISVLDLRKDESIEHAFKGVAKHFQEVYLFLHQVVQ